MTSDARTAGEVRRPTKLAHVVIRTQQHDETVRWYQSVLGAEVVFGSPMLSFLTYDEEHHRIAVVSLPGLEPAHGFTTGVDHFAFTFASLGDLLHTYQRLKAEGITPYWCINHGPTTSLYYRDPNGVQIELQIDNFATDAELNAWMRSGAFAQNPIGVEFDPDVLASRFAAGEPLEDLVKQGS